MHAFHGGHWGDWAFALDSRDDSTQTLHWTWGGFQEARGSLSGAEFYVENILEETDAPNEWFYDAASATLYYYPNSTSVSNFELVATRLKTLISVRGDPSAPVQQLTIRGLTFAHTESTLLDEYEVPSGGDWSTHRGGALFIEGAQNVVIDNNLFFSVVCVTFSSPSPLFDELCVCDLSQGGNAICLSNYVKNCSLTNNEITLSGDNAIVSVGTAELIDGVDSSTYPSGTLRLEFDCSLRTSQPRSWLQVMWWLQI